MTNIQQLDMYGNKLHVGAWVVTHSNSNGGMFLAKIAKFTDSKVVINKISKDLEEILPRDIYIFSNRLLLYPINLG